MRTAASTADEMVPLRFNDDALMYLTLTGIVGIGKLLSRMAAAR